MSIYRRAARNDANQAAVIEALESIGCLVYVIRQPVDLIVGYRGKWIPCEVKNGAKAPSARSLRDSQEKFAFFSEAHGLPFLVLTSPEQAVLAVRQAVATAEWRSSEGLGPDLPDSIADELPDDCARNRVRRYVMEMVAAERERLLSMPNLMHACDALGAPADGEHCDLLRRALYRA